MEARNNLGISDSQQQEVIQTLRTHNESLPTEEQAKERIRRSLNVSSLDNTFANYIKVAGTEDCLTAFKALASGKTDWQMLLCYGGVGNGKSHLLEATSLALHKQDIFARVMTYYRMMDMLKRTMDRDSIDRMDDIMDLYRKASHLLIDDVGAGVSDTKFCDQKLEEIILYRYRENLFTILVTNLDLKQLPMRVWDRFTDKSKARMVLNQAPSYRRKK